MCVADAGGQEQRVTVYRCQTVPEKRRSYLYDRVRGMSALSGGENGRALKLNRTLSDPPLGPRVPSWLPRQLPPLAATSGRFCRVEPIDSTRHGKALYAVYATDREGRLWTYLPWGPYSGPEEFCAQIDAVRASGVRPEYALIDLASGKPFGQASYLNIDPAAGSIVLHRLGCGKPTLKCRRVYNPAHLDQCVFRAYAAGRDGIDPCAQFLGPGIRSPRQVCPEAAFAIRSVGGVQRLPVPGAVDWFDPAGSSVHHRKRRQLPG